MIHWNGLSIQTAPNTFLNQTNKFQLSNCKKMGMNYIAFTLHKWKGHMLFMVVMCIAESKTFTEKDIWLNCRVHTEFICLPNINIRKLLSWKTKTKWNADVNQDIFYLGDILSHIQWKGVFDGRHFSDIHFSTFAQSIYKRVAFPHLP